MSERPFNRALPYEPRAGGGCETLLEEECLVHTCSRNADKEASRVSQSEQALRLRRSAALKQPFKLE